MARRSLLTLVSALALVATVTPGHAQDAPKPEAPRAPEAAKGQAERRAGVTLRVQLVISRFEGEKKLASLPYTLIVAADGRPARMRMGVDTPIPVTQPGSDADKPTATYQYRDVGTKLDCHARDLGDGRYHLQISVENSSALRGPGGATREGVPLFRRFEVSLDPVLRDGQSSPTVASTDPVSGEVVKVDVTLAVVK